MICHHNLPNYNNITSFFLFFFFFFFSCLGHLFEGWKEKGFCCCDVQESATLQSPANMPFSPWFFKNKIKKLNTSHVYAILYIKSPSQEISSNPLHILPILILYYYYNDTTQKKIKNKTACYSKPRIITCLHVFLTLNN